MTKRYSIQSPPVPGTETMTDAVAAVARTAGLEAGGSGAAATLASTGRTARPRRMGGNTSTGKSSLHCCSLYWVGRWL